MSPVPVDPPFSFRITKGGTVRIDRAGRTVTIVGGERADRLIARLRMADAQETQQLLARATGNYPRGNG